MFVLRIDFETRLPHPVSKFHEKVMACILIESEIKAAFENLPFFS